MQSFTLLEKIIGNCIKVHLVIGFPLNTWISSSTLLLIEVFHLKIIISEYEQIVLLPHFLFCIVHKVLIVLLALAGLA